MTMAYVESMQEVDWSKRGLYMWNTHGVRPEWADEALRDANRLVLEPDPASTSGRSVRTIGWSASVRRVLTVITVEDQGIVYGVNGWAANRHDRRLYEGARR